MEPHNIDSNFKKIIEGSANFYDPEAEGAREKIWQQVRDNSKNPSRNAVLRWLVAACLLLMVTSTLISVSLVSTRKSMEALVEENNGLQHTIDRQNMAMANTTATPDYIPPADTIYLEKEVIVYQPVSVTDTVNINQIVYVEQEQQPKSPEMVNNSTVNDNLQEPVQGYGKDIIISSNETVDQGKKKKLQIRLGGVREQENYGRSVITAIF